MYEFAIAGMSAPIFLLVLTGMTVGVVGAFIGVGGGYMVTPALIVGRVRATSTASSAAPT